MVSSFLMIRKSSLSVTSDKEARKPRWPSADILCSHPPRGCRPCIADTPADWRRMPGRPRQSRLRTVETDLRPLNLGLATKDRPKPVYTFSAEKETGEENVILFSAEPKRKRNLSTIFGRKRNRKRKSLFSLIIHLYYVNINSTVQFHAVLLLR